MARKGKASLKQKIIIGLNTAWNLYNFRSGLIKSLISQGYEVVAFAPPDNYVKNLENLGCRFVAINMDNKGINPAKDLLLLWRLFCLFLKEKPNLYLGYTIKPNIYGSLVSHFSKVKFINNVAGLGLVFTERSWLQELVKKLYLCAFAGSSKVFFQNDDDLKLFLKNKIVKKDITGLLPGSGVDLKKFNVTPLPNHHHLRFILVARIIREKGVEFFVKAAQLLKKEGFVAEFAVLGFLDSQNPSEISKEDIKKWVSQGSILYLGESSDVRKELAMADCVVLPSFYREGTPKALLEAASMGRPIITTDYVGCRNVVDHGINGFLCQPMDFSDLASKMRMMSMLSHSERTLMGLRGRKKMEQEFDESFVIQKYSEKIHELLD